MLHRSVVSKKINMLSYLQPVVCSARTAPPPVGTRPPCGAKGTKPQVSSHVGVLADYQSLETRPTTHIKCEIADLLVSRLIAERITRKLIRMLPQDSVFPALKSFHPIVPRPPRKYQHHIEPKIERLTPANSEWMAYLDGRSSLGAFLDALA